MQYEPIISIIVAMDRNGVIGKNGTLPWHISEDLKRFKALTMGKAIIMGRKTYESIGKPLPGRRMIVISRNPSLSFEGCEVVTSPDTAIDLVSGEKEVFIIGGAEIFREYLSRVSKLYITRIDAQVEGNVFFPPIQWDEWELVSAIEGNGIAEPSVPYRFEEYSKSP